MIFIKVLLAAAFCIYQGQPPQTFTFNCAAKCNEWNQIECETSNGCVNMYNLCDGRSHCHDNSDEDHRFCSILYQSLCPSSGSFRCNQEGNVTCKRIREYCDESNSPCDNKNEHLCQMFKDGKLQTNLLVAKISGEEFLEKFNVTIEHPDCPHLYTRVGDHCLSFFFFGLVNWGEARSFCKMNGGDLLTFQDGVGIFYEIVRHLHEHSEYWGWAVAECVCALPLDCFHTKVAHRTCQVADDITSDFWVGGAIRNRTWTWVDGNPIELGTPYWSLGENPNCKHRNQTARYKGEFCNQFLQRPLTPVVGMCAALNFENYFYMSDEDCLTKKSPLCVAEKEPTVRA